MQAQQAIGTLLVLDAAVGPLPDVYIEDLKEIESNLVKLTHQSPRVAVANGRVVQ